MNILYVTHYPDLYGANLSLCNLVKQLTTRYKCNAYILCLSNYNEEFEKYALENASCKVIFCKFYNTTFTEGNIIQKIKSQISSIINGIKVRQLKKYIIKNSIDIIHSNSFSTLVGAQIAALYKIPHIWHIREFLEEDYGCSQIKNNIFRKAIDDTDQFIAISKAISRKYKAIVKPEKLTVIYNGLPPIKRKDSTNERRPIVFAIVGVIREEKGTLDAIKAFIMLAQEMVKDCELWIVGGGMENEEDPYVKKVRAEIRDADEIIQTKIKFLGYRKDIISVLDSVDVGLVCSKLEAFGRVTIEYMMKGIFVIGANTGGTSELIEDGKTGKLFKQGDHISLSNIMKDYIMNRERYQLIVEQAEKHSQQFTIEECARKVYRCYKEVLDE